MAIALRPCAAPRCRELVTRGRCSACRSAHAKSSRPSSRERGYNTPAWQRFRADWLRQHPLCGDRLTGPNPEHSMCLNENRVTPATDVDHIARVTGPDDPRFLDESAVQSLCHPCHSVKTQREGRDNRGGSKSTGSTSLQTIAQPRPNVDESKNPAHFVEIV